jgi:GAF domain-containing protein
MRQQHRFRLNETQKYALIGVLFGLLFPAGATLFIMVRLGLPFDLTGVLMAQRMEPLLWIIDTAPFFLGFFAALAGRQQDRLQKMNDDLVQRDEQILRSQADLEQRMRVRTLALEKRTAQLKAVADVGRSITSYRNLTELLQQTTHLIHQNFGYYHSGIFLLDDRREYAVLAAANSEGGQRMLERKHQLKIGETSIVGYAIANIQARIALDVGQDAVFFDNPDLPQTRSEMALPLVAGGQVLGALDIQSTEPQAFTDEDIAALQILAEQVAVAIQNANLFRETEKALETARLFSGEVSRVAWNRILRSQTRIGFLATPPDVSEIKAELSEPSLARAFETGDVIISDDGLTISIPIKIRGQSIGAIRLKKPETSEAWMQDETNLAITLADQLSGALESARLYHESQQRAARESLVSDISAKIGSLVSVDNILKTAMLELGNTLPDTEIAIQFTQGNLEQR